jgi:hypothetical protein
VFSFLIILRCPVKTKLRFVYKNLVTKAVPKHPALVLKLGVIKV